MKTISHLTHVALLSLSVVLVACAAAAPAATQSYAVEDAYYPAPDVAMEGRGAGEIMEMGPGAGAPNTAPAANATRLVIRNANLSIVVDSPEERMDEITSLAERLGGFVVSSNIYKSSLSNGVEVPRGSITIRVPSQQFEQALDEIRAGAIDVPNDSQTGQDVTAEYTDLQSRLRNLEAAETQLRQIMEGAEDTEDVLTAFRELTYITEQIEVLRGQIKYYEESAALSAITVEIIANAAVQPIRIGPWSIEGAARQAVEDLIGALQNLAEFLVWVLIFLIPVLLVIFVPLWFIFNLVRRWRANRKARPAAESKRKAPAKTNAKPKK